MLTLLCAIAIGGPLDPLLAGDVDAILARVRAQGFDAVDAELRALPSPRHTLPGTYTVLAPPRADGGVETRDVHVVILPSGREIAVWTHGWLEDTGDYLGNRKRWVYAVSWSEHTQTGWTAPQAIGRSHMDLEVFVDRAGRLHLFANGYNLEPETSADGVESGHYQVFHARLDGDGFTPWRGVLPRQTDLLHGWDVADGPDGDLLLAWAPWFYDPHYASDGQTLFVRALTDDALGEPRALAALPGRNVSSPQFVPEDGELALYASWQTTDYKTLGVARVDLDGQRIDPLHDRAIDFLREPSEPGAREVLTWLESGDDTVIAHIGAHELPLAAAGTLGRAPLAVFDDYVAIAYDGGVYLLRRGRKRWEAQVIAPPRAETSGPFPRKFTGEPSLQIDGDEAVIAWQDVDRGLIVWRGPIRPTATWPEITWAESAGLGFGAGALADLGGRMMRMADDAEPLDAACLRDIVGWGLRELGGPGYRSEPLTEAPAHCHEKPPPKERLGSSPR
ncbi:MAG: hypothetical protein EP330_28760 [Deltaproteobacteria bacterium]|nr:MAG: hypothetical protein EP330_28760 [Deltaproteobacteria bacterium]